VCEGQEAIAEGIARGDKAIVSFCRSWVAHAYLRKGDWETAREHAAASLAEAPTIYFRTFPQAFHARAVAGLGDVSGGIAVLAQVEPLVEASAHRPAWCLIASLLGEAYIAAGDQENAHRTMSRVQATGISGQLAFLTGHASRVLGEIALTQGDLAVAATELERAFNIARSTGAENEQCLALASLARLKRKQGDVESARADFQTACEALERLGTLHEPDVIREQLAGFPTCGG
jgi:tetratricopeptide (TPR) repeat protein